MLSADGCAADRGSHHRPVLHPTLEARVETLMVAARAWLSNEAEG
jgi:hypothetical protein